MNVASHALVYIAAQSAVNVSIGAAMDIAAQSAVNVSIGASVNIAAQGAVNVSIGAAMDIADSTVNVPTGVGVNIFTSLPALLMKPGHNKQATGNPECGFLTKNRQTEAAYGHESPKTCESTLALKVSDLSSRSWAALRDKSKFFHLTGLEDVRLAEVFKESAFAFVEGSRGRTRRSRAAERNFHTEF